MRWTAIVSTLAALTGVALGAASRANAGGYHVEYAFTGGSDAASPHGALMKLGGKLYGTSPLNGANGLGAVYSLDPKTGAETVVYSFKGGNDGSNADGSLISVGGTLYGTTSGGGGSSNCGSSGCGTVFSLDPVTGVENVVYAFKGVSDGDEPFAGLIKVGGLLYGTTFGGGSSSCAEDCGTVFSVNPTTGVETVVYVFKGGGDGYNPHSNLLDVAGELYGTTESGGSNNCFAGCSTVFSVNPTTGVEAVVYAFKGGNDGAGLVAGLIKVGGLLYGTTVAGGGSPNCNGGCGTVFSLDPATGTEAVVYAFKGGSDGAFPLGDLVAVEGFLYGTTEGGGYKHGTVYSLNLTTGAKTVLHSFKGLDDGNAPETGLVYSAPRLYGTTDEGGGVASCGKPGCGTVFSLRP